MMPPDDHAPRARFGASTDDTTNPDDDSAGSCLLWVDAHRPRTLGECNYHPHVTDLLLKLIRAGDLPHLLFYGPSGGGKMTRVRCVLNEIFGPGADKCRVESRQVEVPGSSTAVDVEVVRSPHHMQITPSDVGTFKDRHITQILIKELAETPPVSAQKVPYKVVVLTDADSLSETAQAALRRTMEKYSGSCRMIFVAEQASKVMQAVRSRCLQIRIPLETDEAVNATLLAVARKEGFTVPEELTRRIAKHWNGNTRGALLALETVKAESGSAPIQPGLPVPLVGWEILCKEVATKIMAERSPKGAMACRSLLYDLLVANIPPDAIMSRIWKELIKTPQLENDDEKVFALTEALGKFDYSMAMGQKEIFHLEAFVLQCMVVVNGGVAR